MDAGQVQQPMVSVADCYTVVGAVRKPSHLAAVVEVTGRAPRAGDEVVCEEDGAVFTIGSLFGVATSATVPAVLGVTLIPAPGWEGRLERGTRLVKV
jgi:hypothetical protein